MFVLGKYLYLFCSWKIFVELVNDHIYRWGNWGSLKFNELPKVSQPIMADMAALLPLNIQGSFHSATLVYGFIPSIVATQKILRKRKKNLPIGISVFWVWRIHSAWAQNVLRCQIAVSAKKQKWQQWDLTSKDRWPQVDMGLCFTGCHTEYYNCITREWGCCHAFGKPQLAVFLTHYAVMNC